MIRLIFAVLGLTATLPAAEKWVRATSPNFELYTPQGERKAKETILYFEQVREFFEKGFTAKPTNTAPARIILFGSEKQYAPFRPSEAAAAFYQHGLDRDYIVMGGYSTQADRTAVHEYVHLLCRRSGLRLPVWLAEGIAEVYSTFQPFGSKVRIGSPIEGHIYQARSGWIPVARLLGVDHGSAEYNRRAHAGSFYAESWALTHMLMLEIEYRPKFDAFFQAIVAETDAATALQSAYGLTVEQVEKRLTMYVRGDRFYAADFPIKLEKSGLVPTVTPVDEVAAKAILAGVQMNRRNSTGSAEIDALAAAHGDRPEVAEVAAYAACQAKDYAKSRTLFEKALGQPNPPPKLYLDASRVQLYSNQLDDKGIGWTKEAIKMKPDWLEARIQLAEQYLAMNQYPASLAVVRQVTSMDRELAGRFYRVAAYAAAANGFIEEAETSAKLTAKYSVDMYDKEASDRLGAYIARVKQARENASAAQAVIAAQQLIRPVELLETGDDVLPDRPRLVRRSSDGDERVILVEKGEEVEAVEGVLVELECLSPAARMHIETGGKRLTLAIRDPSTIVIRVAEGAESATDMDCGPQRRKVRVDYVPKLDEKFGTSGDLKILGFLP